MSNRFVEQLKTLRTRLPIPGVFHHSAAAVGLDVGSTSIKGVLIKPAPDKPQLIRLSVEPIPPGADAPARAEAARKLVQTLSGSDARIVTALSGPGVVLRSILLPKMTPQELKGALSFEVEKHIPFKPEETSLDYVVLGDRSGGRMEILLAAAKTELVNAHIDLLKSAGVVAHILDLEALALANAWQRSSPPELSGVSALLHIGARGTLLNFFLGSQLQFSREIGVGGEAFTKAVAEGLHLDASEAEALKCSPGGRLDEVTAALQPAWQEWLSQCRISFDFYEDQFSQKVERLELSGGSARLANLKGWIQDSLGLPTEEWDPAAGLSVEVDSREMEKFRGNLGVAIGLAVRELD